MSPRVCTLSLFLCLCSSGCLFETSIRQPIRAFARAPQVTGRILLRAPELPQQVSAFTRVWNARLQILDVKAELLYDGDRAAVTVYNQPAARLDFIASALADPGLFRPNSPAMVNANITRLEQPVPGCECNLLVRVEPDGTFSNAPTPGELVPLGRYGLDAPYTVRVFRVKKKFVESLGAEVVDWIELGVNESDPQRIDATALAVGGRDLPGTAQVEAVER